MASAREMNLHERAFVESFVDARRRGRFLSAFENPKRRRVFTRELCHPKPTFLLFRYAEQIVRSEDKAPMIAARLRGMGAPDRCYIIGGELDGQEVDLDEALKSVVGWSYGEIVSCIPGKLAYLESEEGRMIFHKA